MTPAPDSPRPPEAPATRRARAVVWASGVLAVLAVVLSQQILGGVAVAVGSAVGAGLPTFLAWGPLVVRGDRPSLGGAAACGVLALVGGYLGAAVALGGVASAIGESESAVVLLFSVWVVLPVVVAAALAVAVVQRLLAARRGA